MIPGMFVPMVFGAAMRPEAFTYVVWRDYAEVVGFPGVVIFSFLQVVASNYWIEFDDRILRIHSLVGTRIYDLHKIGRIVAVQNQNGLVSAYLFDQDGNYLREIDESSGAQKAVFGEIMRRTRSNQVELYTRNQRRNWYKRINLRGSPWQACEKPDGYRAIQWENFYTLLVLPPATIGVVYLGIWLIRG